MRRGRGEGPEGHLRRTTRYQHAFLLCPEVGEDGMKIDYIEWALAFALFIMSLGFAVLMFGAAYKMFGG
jgi:hypothetical protein